MWVLGPLLDFPGMTTFIAESASCQFEANGFHAF